MERRKWSCKITTSPVCMQAILPSSCITCSPQGTLPSRTCSKQQRFQQSRQAINHMLKSPLINKFTSRCKDLRQRMSQGTMCRRQCRMRIWQPTSCQSLSSLMWPSLRSVLWISIACLTQTTSTSLLQPSILITSSQEIHRHKHRWCRSVNRQTSS